MATNQMPTRATGVGYFLFAVSFAGLGLLSLGSGDFALNWQPVPAWVPWREPLAYASGLMLLAGGLGMFFSRTALMSAALLMANMLVWLLALRFPRVVSSPTNVALWLGFGETLALVAAGSILVATRAGSEENVRVARLLFGAALLPIGLSHLVYVQPTTDLIPTWLPARIGLTYLTGAGHIAAGVGIMFMVLPRLAATLEAVMLAIFAVLVWAPRLAAAPTSRFAATAFLITTAISGAAWVVATSLRRVPWTYVGWTTPWSGVFSRRPHGPRLTGG